jgi:hypothetical protein
MPIPLGILAVAGAGGAAAGAYEQIATQVLTTATNTITFSSIPSTYKHLQLRVAGQGSSGLQYEVPILQFNGDTGLNYANHYLVGDGGSVTSGAETSTGSIYAGYWPSTGNGASNFGLSIIDILDYSLTSKNKTVRYLSGFTFTNANRSMRLGSGHWRNTAAVASIAIKPLASSTFSVGSRFSLYGIVG